MATQEEWIVWLHREAGKAFLGLSESSPKSRWCILGAKTKEEASVGIWLEVESIQERTIPNNEVIRTLTVSPKTCLIRWDFITHIQVRTSTEEIIGFRSLSRSLRAQQDV